MTHISEQLATEFKFTLDAAADAGNTRAPLFFTKEDDAIVQDWGKHVVWLNPPGLDAPVKWVEKSIKAAMNGATVVMLVRPGLNTGWFRLCLQYGELRFITSQEFVCAECGQHLEFCVVIFRPYLLKGDTNGPPSPA